MKVKSQNPKSCIYEGTIRHRRLTAVRHEFNYRVFMMYVDLEELPIAFDRFWLWSAAKRNVAWFRRSDYLGKSTTSLADSIKALVHTRFGTIPSGPIRLLTNFRYFGFSINPISIYYCFNEDEQVEFVVAEVTNTPWREKQIYAFDARHQSRNSRLQFQTAKAMHVSPFLEMDYEYRFQMNAPDENLSVQIENHPEDAIDSTSVSIAANSKAAFDATLMMKRRSLTSFNLASMLCRFPLMTLRVALGIHWQAFRLWSKGVKVQPHPPEKRESVSGPSFAEPAPSLTEPARFSEKTATQAIPSQSVPSKFTTPNFTEQKIHECT